MDRDSDSTEGAGTWKLSDLLLDVALRIAFPILYLGKLSTEKLCGLSKVSTKPIGTGLWFPMS